MNIIRNQNPQLKQFTEKNIIDYCMNMKDHSIQQTTAIFIQKLFKVYREESQVPPLYLICLKYIKRKQMHHGKDNENESHIQ